MSPFLGQQQKPPVTHDQLCRSARRVSVQLPFLSRQRLLSFRGNDFSVFIGRYTAKRKDRAKLTNDCDLRLTKFICGVLFVSLLPKNRRVVL